MNVAAIEMLFAPPLLNDRVSATSSSRISGYFPFARAASTAFMVGP